MHFRFFWVWHSTFFFVPFIQSTYYDTHACSKHVLAAITAPAPDTVVTMSAIPEQSEEIHQPPQPPPPPEPDSNPQPQDGDEIPPPPIMMGALTPSMTNLPTQTPPVFQDVVEEESEITFHPQDEPIHQPPPPPLAASPMQPSPAAAPPSLDLSAIPEPSLSSSLAPHGAAGTTPTAASTATTSKGFASPDFAIPRPRPQRSRAKSVFGSQEALLDPACVGENGDPLITYRERLGGYLHPRDMRRLVTPFSASNEPDLIVRRHVMLLNFDPLRAIILRDRLLVLIPDGADSMLTDLERRVRGGSHELEAAIFGTSSEMVDSLSQSGHSNHPKGTTTEGPHPPNNNNNKDGTGGSLFRRMLNRLSTIDSDPSGTRQSHHDAQDSAADSQQTIRRNNSSERHLDRHGQDHHTNTHSRLHKDEDPVSNDASEDDGGSLFNTTSASTELGADDNEMRLQSEWDDLQGKEWIQLPFELQCTDAVLQTVVGLLTEDTDELQKATLGYIEEIIGTGRSPANFHGEDPLTIIRAIKDSVREMTGRVKGFVKSMNDTLDDYEDMALMNLSRLITNPERFVQPVPAEVLEEESDEPELILEAYLQHAVSLQNVLDLIQGQIDTAAELVDQKLDAARNKILLANTVITMFALCVQCATMVAGYFGMNLINHMEDSENAFAKVTYWSLAGMVLFFCALMVIMYETGTLPGWSSVRSGGF